MQTGEGKTVTALLPAISYALSGRPVHVVTVNEYLARRDAEQLRPVYESLGLTVGIVESGQSHDMRRRAYSADVTYCTNKDLVFDYLRDRTAMRSAAAGQKSHLLLRGLSFALVDEADSVLIDEAQTPLILAGERPSEGQLPVFRAALELASTLIPGRHFRIVGARRQIELESNGRSVLDGMAYRFEGAWRSPDAREELLCQALSAVHLYQKDRHYIVLDGKVQIVDEYTGRVMPDRSWQYGLHQMIETKEGLTPTNQRDTLAQITYQRFFRRYVRLAGMSGTLREVDGEMLAVYGLRTTSVPTHAPSRRRCIGTTILPTVDQKWQEVALAARREAEAGRAVLIGTRSVAASEAISGILGANGVDHVVLNARQDKAEADAIGNAGLPGRITVATNMAGRGTDIHLSAEVTTRGGLHVILTEYHESARIDRQLIGRAGRQGDPGTFEIIASLDDEIFARFAPLATQVARGLYPFVPSPVVVLAPRYLAQSAAERKGRRTRREIVRNDQELDRSFFFSNQLQ
jgi:preprotein translocase subunit SecA